MFMKLKLIIEMAMDLEQELGVKLMGLGLWAAKVISGGAEEQ